MKKTVVLCLAIVLCLFAVTGSIAYFTDSITAQGQIESGTLDIEQYEFERIKDNTGRYTTALQEYQQQQVLYPCMLPADFENTDHHTERTKYTYAENPNSAIPGLEFKAALLDESVRGFVDKIVVAKNEGSLNNYLRTFVAVPTAFDQAIALDWNTADWTLGNSAIEDVLTIEKHQIQNVPYTIYFATYNSVLGPGVVASPSLLGYYLKPEVGHNKSGYTLKTENGLTVLGTEKELKILVATQAAQVIPTGIEHQEHIEDPNVAMSMTYTVPGHHPWKSTDGASTQNAGN